MLLSGLMHETYNGGASHLAGRVKSWAQKKPHLYKLVRVLVNLGLQHMCERGLSCTPALGRLSEPPQFISLFPGYVRLISAV